MYKAIAFGYYVALPALVFIAAAAFVGFALGHMLGGIL